MGANWKESANNARYRSNLYGLLAAVFREEPTETLIKQLRDPRFAGVLLDMGVDLGETFNKMPDAGLVDILSLEYTRLFIGPENHISAHESIFADMDKGMSALWGTKTVEVKNFIQTAGLDYKLEYNGIPDHISVELEFMQKLTEWESEQWAKQSQKKASYAQGIQRMFLEQHLLCWVDKFCDQVVQKAELSFYREMADLTKVYMQFEQKNMATETAA